METVGSANGPRRYTSNERPSNQLSLDGWLNSTPTEWKSPFGRSVLCGCSNKGLIYECENLNISNQMSWKSFRPEKRSHTVPTQSVLPPVRCWCWCWKLEGGEDSAWSVMMVSLGKLPVSFRLGSLLLPKLAEVAIHRWRCWYGRSSLRVPSVLMVCWLCWTCSSWVGCDGLLRAVIGNQISRSDGRRPANGCVALVLVGVKLCCMGFSGEKCDLKWQVLGVQRVKGS